ADAGIVSGGNRGGADLERGFEPLVELDGSIAETAGDRGASGAVLVHEGAHHIALETLLVVDHVVGDAEALGDAAGVVDVVKRAAASGAGGVGGAEAALVPELHGEPDDGFAGGVEHCRYRRAVHAAGHGDHRGCGRGIHAERASFLLPGAPAATLRWRSIRGGRVSMSAS